MVWNIFKVNNKEIRKASYQVSKCLLKIDNKGTETRLSVFIVDFEEV